MLHAMQILLTDIWGRVEFSSGYLKGFVWKWTTSSAVEIAMLHQSIKFDILPLAMATVI